jgi:hypothetical protein
MAVMIACLLATNIAYARKVTTLVSSTAPFTAYRTYAWMPGMPASHPLVEQDIRALVVMELAARGLNPVNELSDLYVSTSVVTQERTPGAFNTLIVEMYDAHTGQLVWRAAASSKVSTRPWENTERLNDRVERIFETYPINLR